MSEADAQAPVRLAELVASLSLGIDLGFGQPMEHVLRQCRIALQLCESLGLDEHERAAVYYAALLVNVGCHTDAHEQARWFGDDIAMKATKYDHEPFSARDMVAMLRLLGSGGTPLHRVRVAFDFAVSGRKEFDGMIARHARLARLLGEQLGLPPTVLDALGSSYERWDGRGWPGVLSGEAIPLASRIVQLAEFAEVAHRGGGIDAAVEVARRRTGSQFDPRLVDVLVVDADKIFQGLDDGASWVAVVEREPSLAVVLSSDECDRALTAIARFVDLKSPFTLGHSLAVADLARRAAETIHAPARECHALYRAGLVSGFGRLGVSNAIWDKRGPLAASEWERVRLHPHFTERMLSQSDALAPLGRIAVQQRERLDGSGYPRGISGGAISRAGRILGASDAYQAMSEPRPYRPARSPDGIAKELRADVRAGRLDGVAVEAVLQAAGHRPSRRRAGPAGLTAREVEVLCLLARGMSNKAIAAHLAISAKTASNHVEHIYTKINVSNRTEAGLYAMEHGLIADDRGASPRP